MGIGDRLRAVWRSRRADGDEGLGERLDVSYRDQAAALQQVRRGLADLSTQRRRVELRLAAADQQAADAQTRAEAQVGSGDEVGARASLTQVLAAERAADDIRGQRDRLLAEESRLEQTVRELEGRIEDFRGRKDTLAARQTAAEARSALHRAQRDVAAAGGDRGLTAAERDVREAEAKAAAYEELAAEGIIETSTGHALPSSDVDEVETRLQALEQERRNADHGPDSLSQ